MGVKTPVASVQYGINKVRMDAVYGRHKTAGEFKSLGGVVSVEKHERGIVITSENGSVRLTVIAPDCIQIRFQESGTFGVPFSYAVARVSWPDVKFTLGEGDDAFTLDAPEINCVVDLITSLLKLMNDEANLITRD